MTKPSQMCPRYQAAMAILGKRWTGLILRVLMPGPQRYHEIVEQLQEISERMLSARLKELEEQEIVERRVDAGPPVRVEYRLTSKGKALSGVVEAVEEWAGRWVEPPKAKAKRG